MAILKHIANKSSNYSTALTYLMFKHDEYTHMPERTIEGQLKIRDEYYLDSMNCDALSFPEECAETNRSFCKNYGKGEIKSHHYIISFDPLDSTESGLTGDKAQAIGFEFAEKYFAGHQTLICTHTDGHNASGNIHVHIILNSVRKYDIERTDFTERPCDSLAGYKHHVTQKLLDHMKQTLMDICEREHLHQVDLLSPASVKVTEAEYRKAQREQSKKDKFEGSIEGSSISTFQTQKQYLRDAIQEIASYARTPEEFGEELEKHYRIRFKISRGRYSYLHPDRSKYITGRAIGDDYSEGYLRPIFEGNRMSKRTRDDISESTAVYHIAPEKKKSDYSTRRNRQPEYDPSYDYAADPLAALHFYSGLRLVVDLQTCVKARQSRAYARKVKLTNLKQMAQTICYVQEHGFDSQEDISAELGKIDVSMSKLKSAIDENNSRIQKLNKQIHFAGQYYVNRQSIKTSKHDTINRVIDPIGSDNRVTEAQKLFDEAKSFFMAENMLIPKLDNLKTERDRLLKMKNAQMTAYRNFKDIRRELETAGKNVNHILSIEISKDHNRNTAQDR